MAEVICGKEVLSELILECPISEKRKLIVGVFGIAFEGLSKEFRLKVMKSMLNKFKLLKTCRYTASFFELLYILAKNDCESCSQCMTVAFILNYLKDEDTPIEYSENYEYEDTKLGYNNETLEIEKSDKFNHDENGRSISYLGALLGLLADYFKPDEIKQIFDKNIMNTLIFVNHKIGTRSIGQMYTKFCLKSRERTKEYLSALLNGYKDNDFDKSKIFFRQLTILLSSDEDFSQEKIEFGMKSILDTMKENKFYSKITEASIDYIIKLAIKSPIIREWLYSKNKEIR